MGLFMLLVFVISCHEKPASGPKDLQIAFLSDVHLQNLYGQLSDSDFKGVFNPENGRYVLGRTMEAQLHSTRLFNENYFAFLAALDDVVRRGVKFVVLPGDFSDDGQPLNVRGLQEILHDYESKYGLQFIATTGNHDPVRPFAMDAGKTDYLGAGGKRQALMSREGMYQPKSEDENPVVITTDIHKMGYAEILDQMGDFGFFPKQSDRYWETAFSDYSYDDYSFEKASREAALDNRKYPVPPTDFLLPDVSYLEEPVDGLWLLAIDGNVYVPKEDAALDGANPENYEGASIGYNQVLTHKQHLLSWVTKVCREAKKRGKTLIAFSHYPMVEFYDDASPEIRKLFGDHRMELHRVPAEEVARTFAEAGIRLHFGGHLHINDTGIRTYEDGKFLVNVQIPSLAAYIPAYKLLTIHDAENMEVETIKLDSVSRFNELFPLYEKEYAYLDSLQSPSIWNPAILNAANYHDYTAFHLKELVRLRFLNEDWPEDLRNFLIGSTGQEMLDYLLLNTRNTAAATATGTATGTGTGTGTGTATATETATGTATATATGDWTGQDLIYDFYRLRSADQLAVPDIGAERMEDYQHFFQLVKQAVPKPESAARIGQLKDLADIFEHFLNGAPADHFSIRLSAKDAILVPLN
ncbi:calcineurin-like phosphoesterase family protein [Mangrovibacterium marinum]|uniref:Calcineurin-like phosphoesterase family protein n=2 Tax=Mangrovibacterium marinum TaxID=1639118 RepID=A0A2T5BXI9_9BACT|nr:calcineurin-like phosphoesterase family protein [Mangrovibacterium marinum]